MLSLFRRRTMLRTTNDNTTSNQPTSRSRTRPKCQKQNKKLIVTMIVPPSEQSDRHGAISMDEEEACKSCARWSSGAGGHRRSLREAQDLPLDWTRRLGGRLLGGKKTPRQPEGNDRPCPGGERGRDSGRCGLVPDIYIYIYRVQPGSARGF